jgi:uncharacterized protein (TIGR00251 family)
LPPWASHDPEADVWTLRIQLQPGAKFNEVVGEFDDRLKLKIAAPPVDNKANIALIHYVAGLAGVSPGRVEILRGSHARRKTLLVHGAGRNLVLLLTQKP